MEGLKTDQHFRVLINLMEMFNSLTLRTLLLSLVENMKKIYSQVLKRYHNILKDIAKY